MPTDPKNKIETLLEAFARKRKAQAGGPFEVSEATRRVLGAEIARTYAKRSEGRFDLAGLAARFWPRFAVGGVTAAALVLAVLTFYPDRPRPLEQPLSKTAAPGSVGPVDAYTQTPEPAAPRAKGAAVAQRFATDQPSPRMKETRGGSVPGRKLAAIEAAPEEVTALESTAAKPPAAIPTSFPSLPSARTTALALGKSVQFRSLESSSNWSFQNNIQPAQALLNSFKLERNGQRIRIIDEDGSIYEGPSLAAITSAQAGSRVSNAPRPRPASSVEEESLKRKIALAQRAPEAGQDADTYFLRVVGTNRSLKQSVRIEGNLLWGAPGSEPSALRGEAIVGGTNRIEINAVPISTHR